MLGGRPYDFYFNGPKLHMIVLHEDGVTYWVVNTLLDNISNETMIAIAKGLRAAEGEEVAFAPVARIAFFGAGYAGLVSGACLADLGHTVVIRDVAPERIEALRAGRVPFHEPGLVELIAATASA